MNSNMVLTLTQWGIILKVSSCDEFRHSGSNLNSSSHFQLPKGHLHQGSLPEPLVQNFAHPHTLHHE